MIMSWCEIISDQKYTWQWKQEHDKTEPINLKQDFIWKAQSEAWFLSALTQN